MQAWRFYHPKFAYKNDLDDDYSPWVGHQNFVYDLIAWQKPQTIVELGTEKGTSLLAMAQVVQDRALKTKLTAIDTWQGDKHTGAYDSDVLIQLRRLLKKHYTQIKVKLMVSTFDQALKKFKDESIDLLHIDGLHTYKAVKHDFDTWLPKVKKTGFIIFHDTVVKKGNFGVWRHWQKITKQFPATINFLHSNGLGVLSLAGDLPATILKPEIIQYYQQQADLALIKRQYKKTLNLIPWQIDLLKNSFKNRLILQDNLISRILLKIWNKLTGHS